MGRVYVAVDLETTGFDPKKDTIIELGAVRFRDGEVLDTFSQVVNPGRPIPRAIQQLTGISQAEVDAAPPLARVAAAFRRFIDEHPLVGPQHRLRRRVPALAQSLSLQSPDRHLGTGSDPGPRPLQLQTGRGWPSISPWIWKTRTAPMPTPSPPCKCSKSCGRPPAPSPPRSCSRSTNLPPAPIGRCAISSPTPNGTQPSAGRGVLPPPPPPAIRSRSLPRPCVLQPVEHPQPLDVAELAAMLQPGGLFARRFAAYEYRPPQVQMLRNGSHRLQPRANTSWSRRAPAPANRWPISSLPWPGPCKRGSGWWSAATPSTCKTSFFKKTCPIYKICCLSPSGRR